MPAGITIPWLARGELWQVKVRTRNDKPKYLSVTWADAERADQDGGHPLLYGADNLSGRHTALLVEGEFDAMLADQVCGDFLDLASLGSASADIPPEAAVLLLPVARVLLLYDADDGGREAVERLRAKYGSTRAVIIPEDGVDVTDFHLGGGYLRDLLQPELYPRTS